MPVSAHDVAAELRKRMPGLGARKLHKLLYYTQGHHLATFGRPLFKEAISAWDAGPVVGALWYAVDPGEATREGPARLGEAELNTIGYVISRYGALTALDLENLTRAEPPWQRADAARRPGESARIEPAWITEYFRAAGAVAAAEDGIALDSAEVTQMIGDTWQRRADPLKPDNLNELRAMLKERRSAR